VKLPNSATLRNAWTQAVFRSTEAPFAVANPLASDPLVPNQIQALFKSVEIRWSRLLWNESVAAALLRAAALGCFDRYVEAFGPIL
jgi:hypothetical protein